VREGALAYYGLSPWLWLLGCQASFVGRYASVSERLLSTITRIDFVIWMEWAIYLFQNENSFVESYAYVPQRLLATIARIEFSIWIEKAVYIF